MSVLVAGGTGFIGRALVAALTREGYDVQVLSRRKGAGSITWKDIKREGLPKCHAVINLAGEPVMGQKWTPEFKKKLRDSRVKTTEALVKAIAASQEPPAVFINASAVGIYPALVDAVWTEESEVPPDDAFLSQLAHEWEAAAGLPAGLPTRQAIVRIGVVLGKGGGALEKMLPPFKMGLGGRVGSGFQPFPWIHLDDLVRLFLFIVRNEQASGLFNGVAPGCVTNGQLTYALGKALHRPTLLPMPAWVANLIFGERAEMLLYGQRVVPERAVRLGFDFGYETIEAALGDLT